MTVAFSRLAASLLVYAGFALFQAVANRQPLGVLARRRPAVRIAARVMATGVAAGAAALLAGAVGWAEALLFSILALVSAASVFVLLAPVQPRLAWGAACVAPFVSVGLFLASRCLQ